MGTGFFAWYNNEEDCKCYIVMCLYGNYIVKPAKVFLFCGYLI